MRKKYTQRRLKELAGQGHARDITRTKEKIKGLRQVGYSSGKDGCNGMLLKSEDGQLYVITSRSSALFYY